MEKISVVTSLLNILNNTNTNKVDYAIAEGMLKNFHRITLISIHDMAELCFVSSSSLSRFVKKNGFHSYSDFKHSCQEQIAIEVDYSKKVQKANQNDLIPIFNYYTENVVCNLSYNFESIQKVDLNHICQLIHDASDVAFLGLEFANIIGQHLQIKLAECNRFVHLKRYGIKDLDLVDTLVNNSVVIIASLEGGYLYRHHDVIKKLKEKNITIIAITMENNSKLFRDVDYLMFCNKYNSETEGRISLLYTIELLIMAYYINYKY